MSQTLQIPAFPLRGSSLIEASAGTGKTYTIALLYVRLVLGHGKANAFARPMVPPEILVVTFTEAASQELSDRIRARLTEAATAFADPAACKLCDAELQALVSDYPVNEHPSCALKLQRAAEWMDEAAVSTIHSWCYRMLREHAFDSNHLFEQELISDQSSLLQEIVEDYWRQNFYQLPRDMAAIIDGNLGSPAKFSEIVRHLAGKASLVPVYASNNLPAIDPFKEIAVKQRAWQAESAAFNQWNDEKARLNELARTAWQDDIGAVESLLSSVWDDLIPRSYKGGDKDVVFSSLRGWVAGEGSADLKNFAQGNFKLYKGKPEPVHPAFAAIAALIAHDSSKPAKPAKNLDVSLELAVLRHQAAQWVRAELDRRLLKRAELGYDDMLVRLRQALQGGSGERLAAAIREQFPVAMIDEFQDTDPVQYGIFNAIYVVEANQPDTAFVMIGDPKQAIYAFRGADIYTYLAARQATEGRHYTLGTNFRSTDAVVTTVNQLFAHAESEHERGAFRFKEGESNPVPFQPVKSNGRKEALLINSNLVPAITGWFMQGENACGVTGPGDYRNAISAAAASEIVRWLQLGKDGRAGFQEEGKPFRPLQPKDIAILVRTGTEAAVIRHALADRGVNSVYLSDKDSVFSSPEAKDVLRWLRAVAEPGNERLLKAALATAGLDIPLAQLKKLLEDETQWEETVMRFRRYRELWLKQGVLPMLRKLLADYSVPVRLLHSENGERALTNVLHIAEWLQQASGTVDGEQALIRLLVEKINQPTEEDVLRLESDADLVKVVTIHKSKGLEYPLVLLPFVCSTRILDGKTARTVTYHEKDAAGNLAVKIELAGGSSAAPDSYKKANAERIDEDMRLLYVALTRAQHALWLGITPLGATKASEETCLHHGAFGYLLAGGKPVAPADVRSAVEKFSTDQFGIVDLPQSSPVRYEWSEEQALNAAKALAAPVAGESWWVASYSALKTGEINGALEGSVSVMPEPEDARQATADEESEAEGTLSSQSLPAGNQQLTMHQFPRGPNPGTFLHSLLEWAAEQEFALALQEDAARREYIARCCNRRGWDKWISGLDGWMKLLLDTPLPVDGKKIRLADVNNCLPEMEFWFESRYVNTFALDKLVHAQTLAARPRPQLLNNVLNGMLKGFVDLVFEYDGQYFVADWKSNWLGDNAAAYTREAMCDAVLHKRYELQYTLYLLALHRHLQDRLHDYDYDNHIGGAVYVFLRGIENPDTRGVHFEKPPRQLIEALDALFASAGKREVAA